ncbi:methyltransferase domain-containing protein [Roseivirga sp.]|uniref:class I SAM-dependent methyltransferase n=1 Tax=Roseivirga sp. TaxID=1964215 RepID=UPI003B8C09F9
MNQHFTDHFQFLKRAGNLEERSSGHWVGKGQNLDVSYPASHHNILLEEQEKSFWYRHRKKCLSLILDSFPTREILDVGASNGLLASYLSTKSRFAILEPHVAGIENAVSLGIKPVIQADFLTAAFEQDSIPAIGLFDVLEHIEHDLTFLKEVRRTLEPGGKLYLTVPAFHALWSEFDVQVGHFRRYNRKRLEEQLKLAGFEIEYFTYLFAPLPLFIWIQRVIGGKKSATATTKSHYAEGGIIGSMLKRLLSPEFYMIRKQKTVPWGSSCLCVVSKPQR